MRHEVLHGVVHLRLVGLVGELIQVNRNAVVRNNRAVAEAAEVMEHVDAGRNAESVVLRDGQILVGRHRDAVLHVPIGALKAVPRNTREIVGGHEIEQGNASLGILGLRVDNVLALAAVHIAKAILRVGAQARQGDEGLEVALGLVELGVRAHRHPAGNVEHILAGLQVLLIDVGGHREGVGIEQASLVGLVVEAHRSPEDALGIGELVVLKRGGVDRGNAEHTAGRLDQVDALLRPKAEGEDPLAPALACAEPGAAAVGLEAVSRLRLERDELLEDVEEILVIAFELRIAGFLVQIPADVMAAGRHGAVVPGALAHTPQVHIAVGAIGSHTLRFDHHSAGGIVESVGGILLKVGLKVQSGIGLDQHRELLRGIGQHENVGQIAASHESRELRRPVSLRQSRQVQVDIKGFLHILGDRVASQAVRLAAADKGNDVKRDALRKLGFLSAVSGIAGIAGIGGRRSAACGSSLAGIVAGGQAADHGDSEGCCDQSKR